MKLMSSRSVRSSAASAAFGDVTGPGSRARMRMREENAKKDRVYVTSRCIKKRAGESSIRR